MKQRAQSIQNNMGTLERVWKDGLKNMAQDWNDFKQWIGDFGNDSQESRLRAAVAELIRAN